MSNFVYMSSAKMDVPGAMAALEHIENFQLMILGVDPSYTISRDQAREILNRQPGSCGHQTCSIRVHKDFGLEEDDYMYIVF